MTDLYDEFERARDAFLEKLAVCYADEFVEAKDYLDAYDALRRDLT